MQKKNLNIGLIGYGKMGKTIEKLAISKNHSIGLISNSSHLLRDQENKIKDLDVAIEFTTPHTAVENLSLLAKHKIPTVCGSTAWLEKYEEVCALFQMNKTPFLYASNFSVGVNLFFAVNKNLAKMMNTLENYDVHITESHHLEKKDAPSGTAITIAEQILENINRKNKWTVDKPSSNDSIGITSIREMDVKGMHEVVYTSNEDELIIKHNAFSRDGFAKGALLATEWIYDKKGIHTMSDIFNF